VKALATKVSVLLDLVARQRARLFMVNGVLSCARAACAEQANNLEAGDPDLYGAIEAAQELLNGIAEELDPTTLEKLVRAEAPAD
jgi:hypothetical protein